jgi:nucleoid-associated protein YgaU
MTLPADRGAGLPMVCPFVAFADERDLRAAEPDHRHRCYAEPRPAPRALAHQTRYCLSPGFTSCPTFQDWATREAARVADEPLPAEAARVADEPLPAEAAGAGGLPGLFDDEREGAAAAPPGGAGPAGASAPAPDELDERESGGLTRQYAGDDAEIDAGDDARPAGDRLAERAGVGAGRVADWDRPRRRDYPRIGRSSRVPPVLVGLVLLAIAALVLFFLPSIISGMFGSRPAGASPSPSGSVGASGASATPTGPTAVPSATPLTYKVVSGDTLTKIAKKFNVTVPQILAANPTIKNADSITVDQVIVIPTPGASPSSSAAP